MQLCIIGIGGWTSLQLGISSRRLSNPMLTRFDLLSFMAPAKSSSQSNLLFDFVITIIETIQQRELFMKNILNIIQTHFN